MSKNPVSKSKPVKRNEPMHNALKFFLAGCVAEIYLLVIRRFYVNGTANELLACDAALPYLMAAGAAVAVIGLVLGIVWRQQTKRRWIGWSVFAAGVFLGGSAWMIRTFYDSALTFLCVVVPVVMLLGILWNLYDRECSWSLTILGASLIALWVCRRVLDSIFLGTYVRIAAVVYIVVLIVAAFLTNKADKNGGKLGNLQVLTAGADPMPIYAACGLSVVALAIALFSSTIAYYAMWLRRYMVDEMNKDYIRTAFSRGRTRVDALKKHALRNAMIPVIAFLAVTAAELVAGSIVVEQVFAVPGIGRLLLASIGSRDFPVAQAVVVLLAVWVVVVNFIADILYQYMDPRVRIQ